MCSLAVMFQAKTAVDYKVTQKMKAAGTIAKGGNADMSLPSIYKAITGSEISNHHNAGHDATATAPTRTSPRKQRRLSGNGFVHGAGHHKMQELRKKHRPCRVCSILKKANLLKGKVKNSKFGCRNCQIRTDGTDGVYVCKEHWDSQIGEDLHLAGWKADQLDGKLSDLVEA